MPRPLAVTPGPPDTRARSDRWRRCCAGELPAECLPQRDRDDLVAELHTLGWDATHIATHTRMSTYTTGRILDRLGLDPNRSKDTAA